MGHGFWRAISVGREAELLRTVSGEKPDHRCPGEEQQHGEPEYPAPREPRQHERCRREGDDRREAGGEVEEAEGSAALAGWPPRGDEPARRREAHRLGIPVERPRHCEAPESSPEAREPVE